MKRIFNINETELRHIVKHSVSQYLNENMAVWKWIDEIKSVSNKIYQTLQNCLPALQKGKIFQEKIDILGIHANIIYQQQNKREYSGLSHETENVIDIYVSANNTEKEIEDILTHELTHQNNKLYNKTKTGHYFGQHTFTWKGTQSKCLEDVNKILYNLWSNDEISAYQARAVHANFGVLKNRYEKLKDLIDGLKRKHPNEEDVYAAVRQYLEQNKRKATKAKTGKYVGYNRLPSMLNFKAWFIEQSEKRLELYWKKLLKNWYKYHTEVSPDLAVDSLRNAQNGLQVLNNKLDKSKKYLMENIDEIAAQFTSQFIQHIHNYWQFSSGDIVVDLGQVKFYVDTWSTYKTKRITTSYGYKMAQTCVFTHKNEAAYFEYDKHEGKYIFNVYPNANLEKIMQLNKTKNRDSFEYDSNLIYAEFKKMLKKALKEVKLTK